MRSISLVVTVLLIGSLSLTWAGGSKSSSPTKKVLFARAQAAKAPANARRLKYRAINGGQYDDSKGIFELVGNAWLQTDDLSITAQRIAVRFSKKDKEIVEVRATGGAVRIEAQAARVGASSSQPMVATCREAVYRGANREITLEGPVSITGKGKPDSKILDLSVTAAKAFIDLAGDGIVVRFEGETAGEFLLQGDIMPGKPPGKAAEKTERSEEKSVEANG